MRFPGGANGIGAATVRLLYDHGVSIVFGDQDGDEGEKTSAQYDRERVLFVQMDVTQYEDVVKLFRLALDKHGHIDHAISVAGVTEQGNAFDPALTIDSVAQV